MSPQPRQLLLFLAGLLVLAALLLWVFQPGLFPQRQAADVVLAQATRTRTPTPTPPATPEPDEEELGIERFVADAPGPNPMLIGFGADIQYLLLLPELCSDTFVPPGGEAWMISSRHVIIGASRPASALETTLYIQRCVETLPEIVLEAEAPRVIEGMLQVDPSAFRPSLILPMLRATVSVLEAQPQSTPRPPVAEPLFPTVDMLPIVPTLQAPERFVDLVEATVTLTTPDGTRIVLDNEARPDLWRYEFPISSETGTYTVNVRAAETEIAWTVTVSGEPRIYLTAGDTVQNSFANAAEAVVHFAGFEPDRAVTIWLYGVLGLPEAIDAETAQPVALAPMGHWEFMGEALPEETLASLLRQGGGPPFGNFVLLACYSDQCRQLPLVTPYGVEWPDYFFASAYVPASTEGLALPPSVSDIRFARGATSAVVDVPLAGQGVAAYRLGIRAGQELILTADRPNLYAYVLGPDGDLLPGEAFSTGAMSIPENGRYTLLVYGQADAQMTVEIPAN